MARSLVVVPCGRSKIWDKTPNQGPARASEAYVGPPFRLNRAYAERFGDAWVILSAKYGFVEPDFVIPGPYEVTFKRPSTGPISVQLLRQQIDDLRLDRYDLVVGLGGHEYRTAIQAAFASLSSRLVFPFAGLSIGRAMQATKRAIAVGDPGFAVEEG